MNAAARHPLLMRTALWSGGFGLALALCWVWLGGTSVYTDFTQNAWLPARLVLAGGSPYDPTRAQVDSALGAFAGTFPSFNSGADFHFIYPLWVALLSIPFAMLPLVMALTVWRAINLLVLIWSALTLLRYGNAAFRVPSVPITVTLVITTGFAVLYHKSLLTLAIGQFSIIELGLLVGAWKYLVTTPPQEPGAHRRQRSGDLLLGAVLAVLLTKPQALGLPVALLVLWAVARRRWAIPAGVLGGGVVLLGGPALVFPGALSAWLQLVLGGQAQSQVTVSASVWGLSYQTLGPNGPWLAVAGTLTALGLLLLIPLWWRDLRDATARVPAALPITICANSILSPYLLGYEQVLLLLPALLILAAAGPPTRAVDRAGQARARAAQRWRLVIYTWMSAFAIIVTVLQLMIRLEYPAILLSLTMLGLCGVAYPGWRGKPRRVTGTDEAFGHALS